MDCLAGLLDFVSRNILISKMFLSPATEVAALKEKLERKGGIFEAAGAASLGAERIHQLHSQVQLLKSNEKEMRKEIDDLENERRELQKKVKNLERERDTSVQRTNELLGSNH